MDLWIGVSPAVAKVLDRNKKDRPDPFLARTILHEKRNDDSKVSARAIEDKRAAIGAEVPCASKGRIREGVV